MLPFSYIFRFLAFLIPLSVVSTVYLYYYPAFHSCQFPATADGQVAPFRLLTFGDPQLEGDTSIPKLPQINFPNATVFLEQVQARDYVTISKEFLSVFNFLWEGFTLPFRRVRKRIDLLGNDLYLAHIYRTMHWWSEPTHTTVLGDLLGSQWITDEEFGRRSWRYWNRVFAGSEVCDSSLINPNFTGAYKPHWEFIGQHPDWPRRIINVAGNHDIGYSGDVTEERIKRFEREFGPVNGEITFALPEGSHNATDIAALSPAIRIVILNTMTLDGPARSHKKHVETINFINSAIGVSASVETHNTAIILLTHIPLHKEAGICVDDPLFLYHSDETVKEQNMLSPSNSQQAVLQGLFGFHPDTNAPARGLGRDGIILNGHDHEGCDVYHYIDREKRLWNATTWNNATIQDDVPGIREVTVRSMMGAFGGNTALLSAWWEHDKQSWSFEVSNCKLGVQHVWWSIHILDVLTFSLIAYATISYFISTPLHQRSWNLLHGLDRNRKQKTA